MTTFYPSPGQPRPPDVPARPFELSLAPPPPSDYYRRDPDYVRAVDLDNTTFARANSNYNAWQARHSDLWHRIVEWLAGAGCLPELGAARAALTRTNQVAEAVGQRLAEALSRQAKADDDLADTVNRCVTEGAKLTDRAGEAVIAARRQVEAVQVVADAVAAQKPVAERRAQKALGSIDWRQALEAVERLSGDDAAAAAEWVRAQLDGPGPGPRVDPLRWI